jgi:NADPH:quinone reductase-like Zn-dependent oxidoreductase
MDPQNVALWRPSRAARFTVGPAPYTHPGPGEVVVRVGAVALNPVDNLPALGYRFGMPWLTFPAILGGDVAGEVVEVGPGVDRIRVGDRVLGMAAGREKDRNSPAEGGFQQYVVLLQQLVSPIPDELPFERAAVLPLTLSTAATGLFQRDHLGLTLPAATPVGRSETVLIWGGSTSVGTNGIQLARCAGYRVLATASPRNFDYVRSLGAEAVVDYHDKNAADRIVDLLGESELAGTLAVGSQSVTAAARIASRVPGSRRIATATLGPAERLRAARLRRKGIQLSLIWGGALKDDEVAPAIFGGFLPAALRDGRYRTAPEPTIAGHGLDAIPDALRRLRSGVSATKLVVSL